MTALQVAADLRAAAALLEIDGWTQGAMRDEDGCRCAIGALAAVTRDAQRIIDAARAIDAEKPLDLITWNDQPGRTATDVITAFRRAADRLTGYPAAAR